MSDPHLQKAIDELRTELEALPSDAPGRERLVALLEQVEAHAASDQGTVPHEPLVDGLDAAVTEFEVEHPRATALLQRIVSALSSMGI
ncbi:MAG: DUF4404 family protein [Nevskiales bacterium]|nr:DUF4404 family protein [Nevskiales bacterium]